MRLLIFTQIVDQDDPVLGFFHRWIEECARRCEHVYVICLLEGRYALPSNVTVLSLGKEKRRVQRNIVLKSLSRLIYLYHFFSYIWKYRKDYDSVFVHMNQIYVVLGGLWWKLWRKRVCLWYAHGAVSLSLRIAEKYADVIVTSTSVRGFTLPSKKVHIIGQGIDTQLFTCVGVERSQKESISIVYCGRIAPVKQCEVLVEAVGILHTQGQAFALTVVGDITVPETKAYYTSLKAQVQMLGIAKNVDFVGAVPHDQIVQYLCTADVFVNPSEMGSLDKAGLEAIAAGVPVITCNEAYQEVFGEFADQLMFLPGDAQMLADHIMSVQSADDRVQMVDTLKRVVHEKHSLEQLIPRILAHCQPI